MHIYCAFTVETVSKFNLAMLFLGRIVTQFWHAYKFLQIDVTE